MRRCRWIQVKERSTSHHLVELRRRRSWVAGLRRFEWRHDRLVSVAARLLIQCIAVVSAVADEVLWPGLDRLEVETQLNPTLLVAAMLARLDQPAKQNLLKRS
jgi:hypothetical protein